MRALLLTSMIVSAVLAGCSPTLRDDVYACTTTSECPPGFQCIGDRCRNRLGTDCPSGRDSECLDNSECTRDLCESGFCTHRPETDAEGAPCEDGVFCNGPNQCSAGVCEPSSIPPCAICDEGSMGCIDCGDVGAPCCAGNLCNDGFCDAGTCAPCGGLGESCCEGGLTCDAGTSCDVVTTGTCVTCGGSGEPCCIDFTFGTAACNAPGETCDFRDEARLPTCGICGHEGEHPCLDGCLEGVIVGGTCTVRGDCGGTDCLEGTVCAVNPDFPESPPFCLPCGVFGTYCCPGQAVCNDPRMGRTECMSGYCGGVTPVEG